MSNSNTEAMSWNKHTNCDRVGQWRLRLLSLKSVKIIKPIIFQRDIAEY